MATKGDTKYTEIVCIGLGFSGICLGVQLKRTLGFDDIHFYDRNPSVAGTWYANQYPGVACDIHAGLYSLSCEPNMEWTRGLTNGKEIKDYLDRVVDKYNLRPKMTFSVEWLSATWDETRQIWSVELKDLKEDKTFIHECRILYSAVGQLVVPKPANIDGISTFKGEIFHTARWRKDVSLKDKDVIIIGNGCSASQVVPCIVNETKSLTQFFRSAQWMFPGSDQPVPSGFRWCLKNIPLANRLFRLFICYKIEIFGEILRLTKKGAKFREEGEAVSKKYILSAAPEKYRSILVPDYPIGCKRRIFDRDSGYMTALHSPNMFITKDPIQKIVPEGVSTGEKVYPADVIILANGFETGLGGLNTVNIYGRGGQSLHEYWKKFGGPMAYNTTAVSGFPNFFFLFGPNTATGHTSLLIAVENTVNYTLKIIRPILSRKALSVDVKKDATEVYATQLQAASRNTVLNSCRSFYVVDGWNSTIYPWSQFHFWWRSVFPRWSDWTYIYNPKSTKFGKIMFGIGLIFLSAVYLNRHLIPTDLKEAAQDTLIRLCAYIQ